MTYRVEYENDLKAILGPDHKWTASDWIKAGTFVLIAIPLILVALVILYIVLAVWHDVVKHIVAYLDEARPRHT